jgi:hypothetical protein
VAMKNHSRSARWAGALRVILPVAHGGGDALRLMIAQYKNKQTHVRHNLLSTLVASASLPVLELGVPGSSPGTKFFVVLFFS